MANRQLDPVVQQIRKLAEGASAAGDRALLDRFVARRDEAAFAELVRQHGPMVLGVCRRVLKHAADAEDACQAAFLVLARQAPSIRKRGSVGSWLHGVAYRVAWRLRRDLARRRAHERPPDRVPAADPAAEVSWREVQAVLDEELGRLPEVLRAPLVLCYLEGKTRDEAARELGWTLATVRGRLDRGRERLRARLTRRGLGLSAALLGAALSEGSATAALPAPLATAAVRAAARIAGGSAPEVAPGVAALGEGVVRTFALGKWKAAVALLVALAVGAVAVVRQPAEGKKPAGAGAPKAAAPAARPRPPERSPQAAAELLALFRGHLPSFVLSVTLYPKGPGGHDPRIDLHNAVLHVPLLRFEPHAFGPNGRPVSANARIPVEHGAALVDALAAGGFFRHARPKDGWRPDPHVEVCASFQSGNTSERYWLDLDWGENAFALLDSFRRPLDGDARKMMDDLLRPLGERQPPPTKNGSGSGQARPQPPPGWRERAVLPWPGHDVVAAAFDRDGRHLVAAGQPRDGANGPVFGIRGGIRSWDAATGKPLHTHVFQGWVTGGPFALSADGRTAAMHGHRGNTPAVIKLVDVASGKEAGSLPAGRGVSCLAFSPDGQALAVGARGPADNLALWDVTTRRARNTVTHPGYVMSAAFLPGGKELVSASIGRVALWKLTPPLEEQPNLKKVGPVSGYAVAVSPDGKTLAVTTAEVEEAADGRVLIRPAVKLLELATGKERATLRRPDGRLHGGPTSLAFSPDGKLLAWALDREWASTPTAQVTLWDVAALRQVAVLTHAEGPSQVLFSPDGRTLVTVGGVVRVWER